MKDYSSVILEGAGGLSAGISSLMSPGSAGDVPGF